MAKNFKAQNPADLFFKSDIPDTIKKEPSPAPVIPVHEEKSPAQSKELRKARAQLVLKPSTLEEIKAIAWEEHKSFNALIEELIEKYIEERKI